MPVKDSDESIIVPKRSRSEGNLPADALLVFSPHDLRLLRAIDPSRWTQSRQLFLSGVHLFRGGGTAVAVVGPMLGAPQAVLVLEKLIALGVTRSLAFGWCGCLMPEMSIGDVVLPHSARSEEGTSAHYSTSPATPAPDPDLYQRICSRLVGAGEFVVHTGEVWSTDAPYRETRGKVESYREQGVLAVEMECSALFTVARYRGVALAACLVVSDDLSSMTWRHGYNDSRFLATRKRLLPYLLDLLSAGPAAG